MFVCFIVSALLVLAPLGDAKSPSDRHSIATTEAVIVTFKGLCVGGVMDGKTITSRFPNGAMIVDRAPAVMHYWWYDWDADNGQFVLRETDDGEVPAGTVERRALYRSAKEAGYDVLAYPFGAREY